MAVVFKSGDLRRSIQIQQRSATIDSVGGQSTTWTTVATVWADIQPLSGRELMAAQEVQAEVSHTISIRYQPLFSDPKAMAAMRVLYGTRIFNISASMNVDERNRLITLMANEGLNDG